MKKIKRHISLECFKSGYPGILPYFRMKNQDKCIYTYGGGKIKLDGKEDVETEEFISKTDGNWREMPLDFKVQNDDSTPKGTYEGKDYKIFSYADLNHRYYKAKSIRGLRLVSFINKEEKRWKLVKNPYEIQENDKIVGISSFYNKSIEAIEEEIERKGYVLSGDENLNECTVVYVVSDIGGYNEMQGNILIPFFENISGLLRVESDINGRNVPGYISYIKIKPFYKWMHDNKDIKEEGTHKRWIDFGGKDMLNFLEKNLNKLDETLEKISRYEFLYPKTEINVFLTSKTNRTGAMSLDDTVIIPEEKKTKRNSVPNKVKALSESRLIEVRSKFLSFDDNGDMIPGILKKKANDGLYFLTNNNGEWIRKTDKELSSYKEFNFIETAVKNYNNDNKSRFGKNFLINYDNGKILEEVNEENIEFFYINDEKQRIWYKTKKEGKIEKVEYDSYSWKYGETIEYGIKDIPDGRIVFLEKNVCDRTGKILYRQGTFVVKNGEEIKKVAAPEKTYIPIEPEKDYIKVKEGDSYVYYGFTGCPDEGLLDFNEENNSGKLFRTKEIVYCDIPYKENDAFNVVELSKDEEKAEGLADFVSKIEYNDKNTEVTIEYYISARCGLKNSVESQEEENTEEINTITDSRPIYNSIDRTCNIIGGIKYTETYLLKKSKKKYLFDGEEIECYINELDEESHKEMVYSDNLSLSRYCQRARVEYGSTKEDLFERNPVFKNEFLNGIDHVNNPEIDILFNRGNASTFENRFKLMECNTFQDLKNYGNNFFNIK